MSHPIEHVRVVALVPRERATTRADCLPAPVAVAYHQTNHERGRLRFFPLSVNPCYTTRPAAQRRVPIAAPSGRVQHKL